jgi:hypothetical protein
MSIQEREYAREVPDVARRYATDTADCVLREEYHRVTPLLKG